MTFRFYKERVLTSRGVRVIAQVTTLDEGRAIISRIISGEIHIDVVLLYGELSDDPFEGEELAPCFRNLGITVIGISNSGSLWADHDPRKDTKTICDIIETL